MRAMVLPFFNRTKCNLALAVALLGGLAACLSIAGAFGIRLNLTGSIPVGMYQVVGDASPLKRGDVVLVCLPEPIAGLAHSRGYIPGGGSCSGRTAPVGKLVMALPGDTVVVTFVGIRVNGRLIPESQPLDHDRNGLPLPRAPLGMSVVAPRSLWLVGKSRHSFDSRYFGPVPTANLLVRVRRL